MYCNSNLNRTAKTRSAETKNLNVNIRIVQIAKETKEFMNQNMLIWRKYIRTYDAVWCEKAQLKIWIRLNLKKKLYEKEKNTPRRCRLLMILKLRKFKLVEPVSRK